MVGNDRRLAARQSKFQSTVQSRVQVLHLPTGTARHGTSVTRAPPEHEMAARARAHTHAIAIRIQYMFRRCN